MHEHRKPTPKPREAKRLRRLERQQRDQSTPEREVPPWKPLG